ncbi:hypothetical protein K438DRAFT_1960136 [Mycena galopus ATCC 62051]|nr:hypothetical protein K438DRAFT_1960136 [Mycena galopus ATCC 62051]
MPAFQNADFINALVQSFTAFTIALDLNVKVTLPWDKWNAMMSYTEMLFNKTEADVLLIKQMQTPDVLLKRCDRSLLLNT